MSMGFAPTWLRQVRPPASHDHFNHCPDIACKQHCRTKSRSVQNEENIYSIEDSRDTPLA